MTSVKAEIVKSEIRNRNRGRRGRGLTAENAESAESEERGAWSVKGGSGFTEGNEGNEEEKFWGHGEARGGQTSVLDKRRNENPPA